MNYKNSIGILSVIIILLCGCQPDKKTTFTAASYNLRNANSADSLQGDGWGNRCLIIADLVQFHEFDIFGTQEGLRHQLDSLKASLPKYDYIGVGRNDGKKEGEHAAIFYRIDKFELLEHGDFWLSETPENRASAGMRFYRESALGDISNTKIPDLNFSFSISTWTI